MKSLDFTTLNEIEEHIKNIQDILKNVLTTSKKNDIVYLTANDVNKILDIYSDINTRKIDYPNKKVYLDNDIIIDLKLYDNFVQRLTKAYMTIANIQKTVLDEETYNKVVYAMN